MIRYTTPTIDIRVRGVDLTDGYRIWVSLRQGDETTTVEVSRPTLDGEDTLLTCELSQLETAALDVGRPVAVQVNWMDRDGHRNATVIAAERVLDNLLDRVLTYE